MEKGLVLGFLIFGILLNLQVANCISCLKCNGVSSLKDCFSAQDSIQKCQPEEACYLDKKLNLETGTNQYYAGCRQLKLCILDQCQKIEWGDGRSRAFADLLHLPVCSECCYESNCNIELCGAKLNEIPLNITQCFNCRGMHDESICSETIDCDLTLDRCLVQKKLGTYDLGCINSRQCGILQALDAENVDTETRCCDKPLCNGNPYISKLDQGSILSKYTCPPLAHPTATKSTNPTQSSHATITPTPATTPSTDAPSTAPTATATSLTQSSHATITPTPATTPSTDAPSTAPTAITSPAPVVTVTPATTHIPTEAPSTAPPPKTLGPTVTTSPVPVVTVTPATTHIPTEAPSTAPPPKTLGPTVTTSCAVCAGPPFLCEKLFAPTPCPAPENYCINTVINHKDGTRNVERKCGDFDTCYREWFQGSSDDDKCRQFDEDNEQRLDFQCTYCCITDDCNVPLRPDAASLYKPA